MGPVTSGREYVAPKGSTFISDVTRFGTKAAGLALLPMKWTPPFIALAAGRYAQVESGAGFDALTSGLRELEPTPDGVLVRSSAVEESMGRRGALDSLRSSNDARDVARAMKRIAADLPVRARPTLAFVVQTWIPNAALGHLSNERRVSQDRRSWLCEAELPVAAADRIFRFRVDSSARFSEDPTCGSFEELAETLRGVARVLGGGGERLHLEWVWDGRRLWLVQCDHDTTPDGAPPGSAWRRAPASSIEQPLTIFSEITHEPSPFPKANHVRLFRHLGLPHGDVRVLAGTDQVRELAEGHISTALEADLRALISEPVVVRTDVRSESVRPEVLSRRTDTCLTLHQLQDFLIRTARASLNAHSDPGDVAFLAHRFLLGRAGAFAYAQPGDARVLVDATWGIPDSLLFHPHDSYRVHTDTGGVERYVRCKTDFIDVDARGRWRSRVAGRPWDWKPTLEDEDARCLADMTRRIADEVDEPVEVMFFVAACRDRSSLVPWFYRSSERLISDLEAAPGFYIGEKVPITGHQDLEAVDRRLGAEPEPRRLTLTLRPSVALLRSKPFISAVADLARRRSLPVELEGSQLSHAYYLLDDAGVAVRAVNPWRAPERRQAFGKLVRDLIPVRIERRGELPTIYHADKRELADLVRAKLVEEALELYWEAAPAAVVEEMADLLELLRTTADVYKVRFKDVESTANRKRAERGGFEAGVVLVETRRAPAGPRIGSAPPLLEERDSRAGRRPFSARRRVLRLPGRRLVLPLVPPTGWTRGASRSVVLDADEEVAVTYGKDAVVIQVRPRVGGPAANQLPLPGLEQPSRPR